MRREIEAAIIRIITGAPSPPGRIGQTRRKHGLIIMRTTMSVLDDVFWNCSWKSCLRAGRRATGEMVLLSLSRTVTRVAANQVLRLVIVA